MFWPLGGDLGNDWGTRGTRHRPTSAEIPRIGVSSPWRISDRVRLTAATGFGVMRVGPAAVSTVFGVRLALNLANGRAVVGPLYRPRRVG